MGSATATAVNVAIDVGGTFTDVVVADDRGHVVGMKLPSNASDFATTLRASLDGQGVRATRLLYSTTVALNALLEHRLPRIGLIVTHGFRELMETARLPAAAASLSLAPRLVALENVRELDARLAADGREVRAPDHAQIARFAHDFAAHGIDIVAVSLLHSYLDPAHEEIVAATFAAVAPAVRVVLSSQVLPELREYERTIAACLNACLMPTVTSHLAQVQTLAPEAPLYVMKSSGGLATAARSMARPLATALSGPSAAVVGMAWFGRTLGYSNLISLDIGGTSTDVALIRDGHYALASAGQVAGFPIKAPMVDVLSIGAGGGSIATQAPDSRWHVGPQSAGAWPGPACYGRGGHAATLTDAELVLGRLPEHLLNGAIALDRAAALGALARFGASRGLDAWTTARGVLMIATHAMCGALRRVSVARGYDPAAYALVAIGGAGPLHGAELAELLGITTVIVPPQPGLAAAWGLMAADLEEDFMRACTQFDDALDIGWIARTVVALEEEAHSFLVAHAVPPAARVIERHLDLRYRGMLGQLCVPLAGGAVSADTLIQVMQEFHARYRAASGHDHAGREAVEILTVRVRARGLCARPALMPAHPVERAARPARDVFFLGEMAACPSAVWARGALARGTRIVGPAVVEQYESTTLVPPRWSATVDQGGNLILSQAGGARPALAERGRFAHAVT